MRRGFTLIELSVVLLIIGLLTGAIIVGRSLLRSSEVKATLVQVEKFRSAVNAFDEKYGSLPGDISASNATNYGFTARAGTAGKGDGNGHIDGNGGLGSVLQAGGETGLFWVDLTSANGLNVNLIDGTYNTATDSSAPTLSLTNISQYMPAAQLGRANYFYVYENENVNYFGLSGVVTVTTGALNSTPSLPVWEAYQIDQKMDDGYPVSGAIIASYVDQNSVYWAAGGGGYGGGYVGASNGNSAVPAESYTCYDNNNTANTILQYSMSYGGANGKYANCALSFTF